MVFGASLGCPGRTPEVRHRMARAKKTLVTVGSLVMVITPCQMATWIACHADADCKLSYKTVHVHWGLSIAAGMVSRARNASIYQRKQSHLLFPFPWSRCRPLASAAKH